MIINRKVSISASILTLICCVYGTFTPALRSVASFAPDAIMPAGTFAFPEFKANWERVDAPVASGQVSRSWLWGPSPGATVEEQFTEARDGVRTVQYFDKARMELNEAATGTENQWRVTTGLLVAEMVSGRIQTGTSDYVNHAPALQVVAGDPVDPTNPKYRDFTSSQAPVIDRTGGRVTDSLIYAGARPVTAEPDVRNKAFVQQTGHNVPDIFWTFLNQQAPAGSAPGILSGKPLFDWVYIMGYPITEAYWINIRLDGKNYDALVQLYQRRTLTYLPALGDQWQVQMGNVGQHYFEWRYGKSAGATPLDTADTAKLPPLKAADGRFVGVDGANFVYQGSPVKLKGTNYWLSNAPFALTWAEWNGPRVRTELQKARDLGINTVRIAIPYDNKVAMDVIWGNFRVMEAISPWIVSQMTQFLQIASQYNMKVIFTFFDGYDQQPPQGSSELATNYAYLDGLVTPFANDDRVLAWDLKNEPDLYSAWKEGKQDNVIVWLKRMAQHVRQIDDRHPITVGVANYKSLWQLASNGTSLLSFVDFVAFHCYDAGALAGQLTEIKAHTAKPILLEEMGWPTSAGKEKAAANAVYDEPTQVFLYKSMLGASKSADIGGVVQWTLADYAAGSTIHDNYESYFGLFKRDGSEKPAASIFRSQFVGPSLKSNSQSNEPLDTSDNPNHH